MALQATTSAHVQATSNAPTPAAARAATSASSVGQAASSAPVDAPSSAASSAGAARVATSKMNATNVADPAVASSGSLAANNRVQSAELLPSIRSVESSSVVILLVFLCGFFVGLFLLGPSITGFAPVLYIRPTYAIHHCDCSSFRYPSLRTFRLGRYSTRDAQP